MPSRMVTTLTLNGARSSHKVSDRVFKATLNIAYAPATRGFHTPGRRQSNQLQDDPSIRPTMRWRRGRGRGGGTRFMDKLTNPGGVENGDQRALVHNPVAARDKKMLGSGDIDVEHGHSVADVKTCDRDVLETTKGLGDIGGVPG
ncbi:hypothetical protein NPX13_g1744 [Xylaria arbuscula]|uniref:Uncharacterized protein n=1 Tax=Xylaria arbuscula TaxID=114810 RepID=A0A9W8NLH4_9PEZI|nr:hypothetical protein NPX13_g1744 [Xylaria arbuscula]